MEDNPSQRNCQNQLSHPSFSHIEQECQESFIQGKIPQIFVKLSFRGLCVSKLSGLRPFDIMAIIH